MKRIIYAFSLVISVLVLFSSCDKSQRTYAAELKAEKLLIEDYIKRNEIKVVDEMPSDDAFLQDENLYYKSTSGLYYRLEKPGVGTDTVDYKVKIQAKYYEYTLTVPADTSNYWDTSVYPYPYEFLLSGTNIGFREAITYMKKSRAEAKLIIPSKLGLNSSVVTPYGYKIQIQFRKDVIPE
ncbi:DUF4827 family protein [Paludibacter sp. 221]|uniref:DUF4827 family protein n=1 Tax=Paludibacter sp. 221 TaxID=2302939 RepID=UPI0013D2A786|nr:DUF4827 family protein [Paludibacter sp. 221]NDV47556.1 DUF4827 family protein [Paludibacter sp. 221]